ncbi:MAG: TonB-dependent receptor [Desulfotalea sp.]|nr:MAG: TonB-dependent receptor [Desulfotalea sp.]
MIKKQIKCKDSVGVALVFLLMSQIISPTAVSAVCCQRETLRYLKGLSFEDLLQAEITSVSKRSESLFTAAAAVSVITAEDIERTGVRSIPEALRMVPGLDVSSIDGSRYAIGSRGFNEYFETKLLVLVDGRTMYTPLYSGVHWNSLDIVMQDIKRIEVIRGPGATVWGSNAVNGVINIITKNSSDTQGGFLSVSIGNFDQPDVSARYGGTLNESVTYRLYAKGYDRAPFDGLETEDAHDSSRSLRAGFRIDSQPSSHNIMSLQGGGFDGEADFEAILTGYLSPPFIRTAGVTETYSGGHILGSWEHRFSDQSNTTLQVYYDRGDRNNVIFTEARDTIDIDFKNQLSIWDNHDIVWGAGYRWTHDDLQGTVTISFDPASNSDQLWSTFLQDDINIVDDFAWVTLGTKLEHNDYTGLEVQPSIKLRLQPTPNQLIWAAVSRAVRTPSRVEADVSVNLGTKVDGQGNLVVQRLEGSDSFDSEILIAYELGYRWRVRRSLSFDVTTYFNDYDKLRTLEPQNKTYYESGETAYLVMPARFENEAQGESYGIEIQSTWQPLDNLKFMGSYSYIDLNLDFKSGSALAGKKLKSGEYAPRHQFKLRYYWDLRPDISLNSELYYVSDIGAGEIDSYIRIDMQLSWQASDSLRFTLGGENLFGPTHQEFFNSLSNIVASEVPRIYWFKTTFWF